MIRFKANCMRWNTTYTLLEWPITWDLWTNQILLFCQTKVAIKTLLTTSCSTQKSVPCSVVNRESFSCSKWKQMQKLSLHSQTMCREWTNLEHSLINGMSLSCLSEPQGSENSEEEEAERMQEPEEMEDTKETRPSKHSRLKYLGTHGDCVHMHRACINLSQTEFQHWEEK